MIERADDFEAERARTGSLLAVDVGAVNTRAILLDTVDGVYRLVARGEAPTTATLPWADVGEGIRQAMLAITRATGRELIDPNDTLIRPERSNRSGIDGFVATASAGKPVRAVLVGLMPDVSVESGRRAAESTYLLVEDTISLADGRTREQQVDTILAIDPDLILIVGGTDGGASESVIEQVETVGLACSLMEEGRRPPVLFAGNAALCEQVKQRIEEAGMIEVSCAANVRPALDIEQLNDAQTELAQLCQRYKSSSTGGFSELGAWSLDGVLPTAKAFGRLIHFMGRLHEWDVLGIDMGSAATTVAASLPRGEFLNVFGDLGVGHSARHVLNYIRPEQLSRWLTFETEDEDDVVDYVWNRWLFPVSVPQTPEDLEMECALAREILRVATVSARQGWRGVTPSGLLPPFGQIVAGGSTLSKAPHPGLSALMLLDGLQPLGITRLLLDPYGLAAALGAAAPLSPLSVVQALQAGFVSLGTVVNVAGRARRGEVVLRGRLVLEDGGEETFEARYGTLTHIPLAPGVRAELVLKPRRVDVGFGGAGRSGKVTIEGSSLGLIVDARGRPLRLPREAEQRRELMHEWHASLVE
jgi:uncharacterized protein (TIGR01319 family)